MHKKATCSAFVPTSQQESYYEALFDDAEPSRNIERVPVMRVTIFNTAESDLELATKPNPATRQAAIKMSLQREKSGHYPQQVPSEREDCDIYEKFLMDEKDSPAQLNKNGTCNRRFAYELEQHQKL